MAVDQVQLEVTINDHSELRNMAQWNPQHFSNDMIRDHLVKVTRQNSIYLVVSLSPLVISGFNPYEGVVLTPISKTVPLSISKTSL